MMEEETVMEKKKHKGKHDKPKPWDEDPNIDRWKIEKFDPSWNEGGLLEVSSFSTLFPQYREKYLQQAWPMVKGALKEYGVSCELNLVEGSMTVSTTRKTRDPYIIVKARDLIRLLSRSVPAPQSEIVVGILVVLSTLSLSMTASPQQPCFGLGLLLKVATHPSLTACGHNDTFLRSKVVLFLVLFNFLQSLLLHNVFFDLLTFTMVEVAIKILNDEVQCDIIKIGNLVRNKERFVKRRQHLVGPNSSTLKALEILTGCYILVQGNTVAAMGSFKGLKQVRKIVEDCIQNKMHPVYHIKILMMKKELEKDPTLANENWDRFLPKFKKKNVKQKKVKSKEKKPYTPFPPPPQPSKVDKLLESGEYFLSERKKESKKWQEKQEKQAEKTAENKRKREAAFIPPEEASKQDSRNHEDQNKDVAATAMSLKEKAKKLKKQKSAENINAEEYIAASGEESSKRKKKSKHS
ncbi:hypothetical protein Pint_05018 [Pistacia integerrima]|uniref:Uncharacterized protein n=1 Tax=Pistacia integerrima TaxID=434235 RepID=A0ACC0Z6K0_9ROSI|nr:hypothetical protein Pint_05018 [Pistacia integerrima]